jgi:ATP-binding cassette subfamily B protein
VLSYFAPHKTRGLIVVICLLLEAALGLAPAIVFKAVIDYLARPGGHFGHLALLVVAGAGSVLVGGLISVAESYVTALISQDIVFALRKELFEALIDQPVSFFTRAGPGT